MATRLELQQELCSFLGSNNVYFQPPETLKLKYPCIVYELDSLKHMHADDKNYVGQRKYVVTYIYYEPDSTLVDLFPMHFPKSGHNRHFTSDNLNHDVYELYW